MKIQAAELLSLLTSGKEGNDTIILRTNHITGIGVGLDDPNRVAQREVVVDGQRFLVQVISLSEPIIDE